LGSRAKNIRIHVPTTAPIEASPLLPILNI
jgi:hypothetical protein